MIVSAVSTPKISLSPFCSLFIPKTSDDEPNPLLSLPDTTRYEEFKKDIFIQPGSFAVISHSTGRWTDEEKESVFFLVRKGAHITLDGSFLEEGYVSLDRVDLIEKIRRVEEMFYCPCSVLLSIRSLPWKRALPFITQLLMQLSGGGVLFLDLPSYERQKVATPSSVIADTSYFLANASLKLSPGVRFIPIFRPGVVVERGQRVEIPLLSELEKILLELRHCPRCGLAFAKQDKAISLGQIDPKALFLEAYTKKIPIRFCLRNHLQKTFAASLDEVSLFENKLSVLESQFFANHEAATEGGVEHLLDQFTASCKGPFS